MSDLSRYAKRASYSALSMGCAFALLACTAKLADDGSGASAGGAPGGPGGNGTGSTGSTGGNTSTEPPPPYAPHTGLLRRLTRTQFRNAVSDLLGVTVNPSALETDSFNGEFAVIGASTVTTSNLGVEQYHTAIETAVDEVFANDTRREAFIGCTPAAANDTCMSDFVTQLGRRAWRRALTTEELDRLLGVAETATTELESAIEGARWATVATLASVNFLYRPELGEPASNGTNRLTGYEIATRLAFLLWNTLPDEQLLDDAENGLLSTNEGVLAAAERLLAAPAGREAASAFAEDYTRMDRVITQPKNAEMYPEYGPELQNAMVRDMREVWANVTLDADASILDVFSTSEVVANAELARVYGLDATGLDSDTFKTFTLPEGDPRAGILTKPAFLSQFANQEEGSPTLRGKFIREALMCTPVRPPPGAVALELPESTPDAPTTKRQRLELHRDQPACALCHEAMDPLGLPLETFDAIGRFRTTENGLTIDPSGSFDGTVVANASELGMVMSESDAIANCFVRKYYSYAVGHEERDVDEIVVQSLTDSFDASGFRLRALIRAVVTSEAFLTVAPQL